MKRNFFTKIALGFLSVCALVLGAVGLNAEKVELITASATTHSEHMDENGDGVCDGCDKIFFKTVTNYAEFTEAIADANVPEIHVTGSVRLSSAPSVVTDKKIVVKNGGSIYVYGISGGKVGISADIDIEEGGELVLTRENSSRAIVGGSILNKGTIRTAGTSDNHIIATVDNQGKISNSDYVVFDYGKLTNSGTVSGKTVYNVSASTVGSDNKVTYSTSGSMVPKFEGVDATSGTFDSYVGEPIGLKVEGLISGVDFDKALKVTWKGDSAEISGATAASYSPVEGDVGKLISVSKVELNTSSATEAYKCFTSASGYKSSFSVSSSTIGNVKFRVNLDRETATVINNADMQAAIANDSITKIVIANGSLSQSFVTSKPITVHSGANVTIYGVSGGSYVSLGGNITVQEGATVTLTTNESRRAVLDGTITNNGTITATTGIQYIRGTMINNGTINNASNIAYDYGKLSGSGTINGQIRCNVGLTEVTDNVVTYQKPAGLWNGYADIGTYDWEVDNPLPFLLTNAIEGLNPANVLTATWNVSGITSPLFMPTSENVGRIYAIDSLSYKSSDTLRYIGLTVGGSSYSPDWSSTNRNIKFSITPAMYDTIYVGGNLASDGNAGNTEDVPLFSLEYALKCVKDNGTIIFVGDAQSMMEDGAYSVEGTLFVGKNITLNGNNHTLLNNTSSDDTYNGLLVKNGVTLTISNLKFGKKAGVTTTEVDIEALNESGYTPNLILQGNIQLNGTRIQRFDTVTLDGATVTATTAKESAISGVNTLYLNNGSTVKGKISVNTLTSTGAASTLHFDNTYLSISTSLSTENPIRVTVDNVSDITGLDQYISAKTMFSLYSGITEDILDSFQLVTTSTYGEFSMSVSGSSVRLQFTYGPADYSAVEEAILLAGTKTASNYKNWSTVEEAIAAVVEGKTSRYQSTVDGYAQAINDAINGLQEKDTPNLVITRDFSKRYDAYAVGVMGDDYTYDGDASTPTIKWYYDNEGVKGAEFADGAKPKDVGTYWVEISFPETDNSFAVSAEKSFTISKAFNKIENISDISKTYDGVAVSAPTFDRLGTGEATILYKVRNALDSTYTTTAPVDAGNYTLKIQIATDSSYESAEVVKYFSIAQKDITGAEIELGEALTYNGSEQTQTIVGVTKDGMAVTYEGLTGNTATNVGENDYTLSITGNGNFTGTATWDWNILPLDITGAEIQLGEALTYNGGEQTQTIVGVTKDGMAVTYEGLTGNKATDVGESDYTLSVTGNGNFTGTAIWAWNILPLDITGAEIELGEALTYTGTLQTQTVASVTLGLFEVTFNVSGNKQTNVGLNDYTLTVTGNGNFCGSAQADWNIAKANAVINVNTKSIVKTYGDVWTLPVASSNFGKVTCNKVVEDMLNAGTYTVTYKVAGTSNYEGDTKTVRVTIKKATFDMSGVTMSDKIVKFDGKTHGIEIEGTLPEGVTVVYEGNGKTEAGVYKVTATFAYDSENYNEIKPMTVTLTINQEEIVDHIGEATDKPHVIVTNEGGFAPNVEIVITEILPENVETGDAVSKKEVVGAAFDIIMKADGATVQPDGKINIKLLIPTDLLDKDFYILHKHNGEFSKVDFTVEGGYAVFSVDKLSEFIFVYDAPFAWWIVVVSAVAVLGGGVAIYLITSKKKAIKESDEDVEEKDEK